MNPKVSQVEINLLGNPGNPLYKNVSVHTVSKPCSVPEAKTETNGLFRNTFPEAACDASAT